MICDRVAMVMGGELKDSGYTDDVLDQGAKEWEIEYSGQELDLDREIAANACRIERKGVKYIIIIYEETLAYKIMDMIRASQGRLLSFNPKRTGLESIYVNKAGVGNDA